jgi:glycosyltransferase involved in cell wall biosynthesis
MLSRLWAQATWPAMLRREGLDLIHHVKNLVTTGSPCPSLVTVHDLTILEHPEIYPAVDVLYWRTVEKRHLRRVSHVLAVSQATADDLVRRYNLASSKITVIHEGIDDAFEPAPPEAVAQVRERYRLPERFLLHVGSISPKKNLAVLVQAFSELRAGGRYDGGLVLVGRPYFKGGDPALEQALAAVNEPDSVVLTGPVPQKDLPALVSAAECFVFPSLHEGFGLVPLEAMACGVPVVAARSGAVDEVLGDAALLVEDPRDALAFACQVESVVTDLALRTRLVDAGMRRAALYSRRRAAELTLELYSSLTAQRKGAA